MSKHVLVFLFLCAACLPGADGPAQSMTLWYRQPATTWLEALPLGNGLIGARVFGGIAQERIALNESTFWSGRPHDYDDPDASTYFPQIRDLVAAEKFQEAEKLANAHFMGRPAGQQAFQPLGDLLLSCAGDDQVEDYRRDLDLRTGIARVSYRAGGVRFTREIFVSYPDRVLVVRIAADQPGCVSAQARLRSPFQGAISAKPGRLVMDGRWNGKHPVTDWVIAPVDGEGLGFRTVLLALPEGGAATADEAALRIGKADAVTFILAAATSYRNYHDIGGDPAAACDTVLAGIAGKDYAALRQRHEADFSALMGRVQLTIGDAAQDRAPTDERLAAMKKGASDAGLEALCFQMGRYLLAASSRPGGQPANLQGIWNEATSPNWGSKYTININTEMNYWPAEVCNLSECHQPLFDMLKDIAVTGAKTAQAYYHCTGWVAHHNIDLWRGTAPVDAACYGMWPLGGAWLCQHLWEHYAFTGDQRFLKEHYPILKGSAQFLLDLLIEEPKHHWLVTPFSMSPEHGYLDSQGRTAVLSPAPTMDIAIMRELFPHCLSAGRILGVDADFGARLAAALDRLPPYQVNRQGYLQEWIEDWRSEGKGHCVSPYFTVYPGSSITLRSEPGLVAAIRKWMEDRPLGGGWVHAWDIALWARLERGDKVAAGLRALVQHSMGPNLNNRGSNQSDANFGLTAAIAEALLQSHAGELHLLPALPTGWPDGAVTGLRGRGGYTVELRWHDGRLASATIRADADGSCTVRHGETTVVVPTTAGRDVHLDGALRIMGE